MSSTNVITGASLSPDAALRFVFRDPEWQQRMALGGTLNVLSLITCATGQTIALPLAFIFWALVCGYKMRVMRVKIADPSAKLPLWNDWVDLLISGLTWFAVSTGFIFFVVSIPTLGFIIGASQGALNALAPNFLFWCVGVFAATFAAGLLVHLIVTYVQANFAQEENTKSAFALLKVLRRLRTNTGPLVCAWLLSIGIYFCAIMIPVMTILGIFFLPTTMFIAEVVAADLIAQAWSQSQSQSQP